MQKSASAFFILVAVAFVSAAPARAAIEYPWCAQYGGGKGGGGGRNCGFVSYEQCMETSRGMGGYCEPNLFYPGSASDTSQSKRKRQR
jgi:hypothetical protein